MTIKVIAFLAIAVFSGGCPKNDGIRVMSTQNSSEDDITIIKKYVATKKGWNQGDYKIEETRQEDQYIVYMVIYVPDLSVQYPGGGKSFEAYYDPVKREVVREMRFQ